MKHLKKVSLINEFDHFIKVSKSGARRQANGKRLSTGAIKNYTNCRRLLFNFESTKGFSIEFTPCLKLTQQSFREKRKFWEHFYRDFTEFMYGSRHFDNYVANQLKNIRTFLRYLFVQKGWQDYQFLPHSWVRSEQIPIVVLSPDQLQFLITNEELDARLTSQQKKSKDIFVVGCSVGLRYCDLINLKKDNLLIENNNSYLVATSSKTGTRTKLLLPPYVLDIFKRYEGRRCHLLPIISNVNLNLNIKKIMEKAGWTYPMAKCRNKHGKPVVLKRKSQLHEGYRFCDLITTHTMRRTAVSTLLSLGLPEHVVRQISGHAAGSREFYRYIAVQQKWQDEKTSNAFEQLLKLNPC